VDHRIGRGFELHSRLAATTFARRLPKPYFQAFQKHHQQPRRWTINPKAASASATRSEEVAPYCLVKPRSSRTSLPLTKVTVWATPLWGLSCAVWAVVRVYVPDSVSSDTVSWVAVSNSLST